MYVWTTGPDFRFPPPSIDGLPEAQPVSKLAGDPPPPNPPEDAVPPPADATVIPSTAIPGTGIPGTASVPQLFIPSAVICMLGATGCLLQYLLTAAGVAGQVDSGVEV